MSFDQHVTLAKEEDFFLFSAIEMAYSTNSKPVINTVTGKTNAFLF